MAEPSAAGQNLLERGHEPVCVPPLEHERRADLQRVAVAARRPDQHAVLAHPLDDLLRGRRVGLGRAWTDDLDTDREADPADLADHRRACGDVAQAARQILPYPGGVLDEAL